MDGSTAALEPADVVVASAGATHPAEAWLDALKPGGRLLLPMTSTKGPGAMLLVSRRGASGFAARFLCPVAFVDFSGARAPDVGDRLAKAFRRHGTPSVKSLRRDSHAEDDTCWLHGVGWCLSCREPAS